MNPRRIRTALVVTCAASVGAAGVGCEILVQLDRSAVDAGGDAGCPICSDVTEEGDETRLDAESTDTGTDAGDAGTEASPADSGAGE
jgi:hypothetical protein